MGVQQDIFPINYIHQIIKSVILYNLKWLITFTNHVDEGISHFQSFVDTSEKTYILRNFPKSPFDGSGLGIAGLKTIFFRICFTVVIVQHLGRVFIYFQKPDLSIFLTWSSWLDGLQ